MAAPSARLRKNLSAPGLLATVRECFENIADHRQRRGSITLPDALMSGLAVFSLKYPSLLKFDQGYAIEEALRHNLRTLYGIDKAPCDTQLRTILDGVDSQSLRPAFRAIHRGVQRGKALEAYEYWEGHYLVSIDGTGQFASSAIGCEQCCRRHSQGKEQYYHQLLGAVIVHPQRKTVLALMPEAITAQDGNEKNDCERNASKRLLKGLREDFPKQKFIVIEDSLASNGPHLKLLQELDLRYIIGVKPGDHQALFEAVGERLIHGQCEEWNLAAHKGIERGYRWTNAVVLNKSHPDVVVNFLEYWEIKDGKERVWSWISDLPLNRQSVEKVMRGGRARWKVENETFNTLKTQGYGLEHNYGHGQKHLATVFAVLTMLAFLIDQVQEHSCRLFQSARAVYSARTSLWERMRALFTDFLICDWETLWNSIAKPTKKPPLTFDTS